MKRKIAFATMFVLLVTAFVTVPRGPADVASAAVADVRVGAITSGHPRLLADDTAFGRVRSETTAGASTEALNAALVTRASSMKAAPVTTYDLKDGDLLLESRQVMDRVYTFSYMYRLTGDVTWKDRAWSELSAAAAFPDWNPAHFLDTAEMLHAFAIGYDWLYSALTAQQRKVLLDSMRTKGIWPALDAYRAKDEWTTYSGNWNVVVNSAIGIAALAIGSDDASLSQTALDRVRVSLPNGLKAYENGGGYDEGLTYWSYATTYLVTYVAALRTAIGSDATILASPGLSRTGAFGASVRGPSGSAFNFGDAYDNEATSEALLGLEYLYDDPGLRATALQATRLDDNTATARTVIWSGLTKAHENATNKTPLTQAFPNAGVATFRSSWTDENASFVAVRDGSTTRGVHSDLDQGSFVFDALGVNWVTDLVPDSYALDGYFDTADETRWDYYRKRAEGQNTVVTNPGAGPDLSPTGTTRPLQVVRSDASTASATMDLTASDADVTSWVRGFQLFDGRRQLLIQDEIKPRGTLDLWTFIHTKAEVKVEDGGRSALLTYKGRSLRATLVSGPGSFRAMDARPLWTSSQSAQTANDKISKLSVQTTVSSDTTFAVQLTPLPDTKAAVARPTVTPIASWSGTQPQPLAAALSVGGRPLPAFRADTLSYTVEASSYAAAPRLAVSLPSANYRSVVTQAAGVPGRAEAEVIGSDGKSTVYTVDYVKGEIPQASISSSREPGSAKNLVDGSLYSGIRATGPTTITSDLGTVQRVNHVEFYWASRSSAVTPLTVDVSQDGTTWRRAYTGQAKTVGLHEWASFNTGPVDARFTRVVVTPPDAGSFSLKDLRVMPDNNAENPELPRRPRPVLDLSATGSELVLGSKTATRTTFTAAPGGQSTTPPLSYVSSDPQIATVSTDGVVTALKAGKVNVAVRATVGGAFVFDVVPLTVVDTSQATLVPTKDAHVHGGSGNDTVPFGRMSTMYVRHTTEWPQFDRYAYLTFDTRTIDRSRIKSAFVEFTASLPADGAVSSVTLDGKAVSSNWDEAAVTFSSRPAFGSQIGSTTVTKTSARVRMDVTSALATSASGDWSVGLTQNAPPAKLADQITIQSRESGDGPRLVVSYR